MLDALPLLLCLGAATIGGVFFAFANFVMKALAALPDAQGVRAMQRINAIVLNPGFMAVFVGTAVLAGLAAFTGIYAWGTPRSLLLLAAGGLYLVGAFGVTAAFNVPRNERLARLDADSDAAADYWPAYVREWSRWNTLRMFASLLSAACAAAALAVPH